MDRTCAICSSSFTPPRFHPFSQTCSKSCSRKLEYRKHRKTYIRRAKRYARDNRPELNAFYREYRKRNVARSKAYSKVGYALKTGKLIRPKECSKCGRKCKPQAHHHNGYQNPLEITWLCRDCHMIIHHWDDTGLSV